MSEYSKRTWVDGEAITAYKLNNMETGIVEAKKAAAEIAGTALTFKTVKAKLPSSVYWLLIVYGDGKFVAVGQGSLAYSEDGVNWRETDTSYPYMAAAAAYGDGKFVVSFGPYIIYSEDGITWQKITMPSVSTSWQRLAYGNGKFIASAPGFVAYSEDGITWNAKESELPGLSALAYGNGKFVAVDGSMIAYSEDGIAWTKGSSSFSMPGISDITYGDGKFVAIANYTGAAVYSDDGITWTETAFPITDVSGMQIAYGNGKFFAVWGSSGFYSEDGITWTGLSSPLADIGHVCDVAYGCGKFVALDSSSDKAICSWDGINWARDCLRIFQNGIDMTESVRFALGL